MSKLSIMHKMVLMLLPSADDAKRNIKEESLKLGEEALTSTADLALVMATFIRRKSETNPIFCSLLHLTQVKMTTSLSRPYIQVARYITTDTSI